VSNAVHRWVRGGVALLLGAVFVYVCAGLSPYFLNNLRLQQFVEELTQRSETATRPADSVQAQVVEKAKQLGLPVEAGQVQVEVSGGSARISVRYLVEVNLPGYTVRLHFSPAAGR